MECEERQKEWTLLVKVLIRFQMLFLAQALFIHSVGMTICWWFYSTHFILIRQLAVSDALLGNIAAI